MDIDKVSHQLLIELGGAQNVLKLNACMTRLRVGLRDLSLANVENIRQIEGVMGVVESDTLQIVLGPGTAAEVRDALRALVGADRGVDVGADVIAGAGDDAASLARRNRAKRRGRISGPTGAILKHLANVFVPMLPGIVAAGLINGITNIMNVVTNGAWNGLWWYECIRTMGWAMFAYLPIFAGYNSAREFGGTPILGGLAGAMCVANDVMPLLSTYGDSQLTLPLTGAVYNPGSGGLIAALLAGGLFACAERGLRRLIPGLVDTFVTPLVVLAVGGVVLAAAVQPVASALTQGIYAAMSFAYDKMGVVGGYLLAATFLPLVSVGLHQALTPIHAMLNDPSGPTGGINYLLPVLMMAGGGQIGAGVALYLKTKNAKLRGYIRESIPVGILGVGEPLMYAVTLPLGKPFITACLGAGFGGAAAVLFRIGTVAQGVSGLFGLLIVQPSQELQYVAAMLCACVGGFALTWFFGVDESRIDDVYGDRNETTEPSR